MPEIVVTVKNKMAVGDGSVIVCNNSDYVVRFVLDSEWDALALRTMRIVYDSYTHTDIAFSGDTVALPAIIDRTSIGIGLYSGDIHTSTCAMFDCERSVMGKNSHAVAPPSSDVYNEIVEMINDGRLKGDKGADGTNGADGANGADGVTFTPSVDSAGNLSWTNDGGLSNPATVNIKGATGAPGKDGSDAAVTAENIQSALGYAPVKDVQVAGSSVLEVGVANVPIASATRAGVVSIPRPVDSGIWNDNGSLKISYATDSEISTRVGSRKAIVCTNLDTAVKAAMCDGKGAAWTSAEQKAARERMGVSAEFELIEEITLSEDVMNVAREAFPDGTPYNLRSLIIVVDSTNVENRSDVGGWVRLNTKLPYTERTYIAFGDFITTNDSFSCFVHRVLSDGSVDSYFARTPDATPTSHTSDRMYIPSNVIRFGMHINDFLLYSIKSAIPANTKIAIYGVRA